MIRKFFEFFPAILNLIKAYFHSLDLTICGVISYILIIKLILSKFCKHVSLLFESKYASELDQEILEDEVSIDLNNYLLRKLTHDQELLLIG